MSTRNRWILIAVCAALAAGIWRCRARDDGAADDTTRARAPLARAPLYFRDGRWVPLDGAELREVFRELASRKPGLIKISGTVREADSGAPIAGAEVVFANAQGESATTADAQGEYTIEVPPGLYRAFARASNHVAVGLAQFERLPGEPGAEAVGTPRDELAPVLAVFRDQRGVDMHLRSGAQISGTVYDQSGRPVPGAIVTGKTDGRLVLILGTDMAETDLDGSFHLEVPSGFVMLGASHEMFAGLAPTSASSVFLAAGESARVDLTLMQGCIITGRVVDGDGHPVGEGSLETYIGGAPPNDFAPVGRIDGAGRFRLARTEPGTIKLRAWPWKSPHTAATELSCEDGARYDDLTLVVPDADPDLEGSAWSADGEPLAGAFVDIIPLSPGGMAQQERTDAYGEWAFYALPAGEYQVTVYVPGRGAAAQQVSVPSRGVRLTTSGTGTISGTAQGVTSGSFTFEIVRCLLPMSDGGVARFDEVSMPRSRRIVSVEHGAFTIDDVPACPLEALIRRGDRVERVGVTVEADRPVSLELDLREAQRVSVYGVVTGPSGPVSGASVSRLPGAGGPRDHYGYAVTDDDGRYELDAYTGDQLFFQGTGGTASAIVTWDDGDRQRIDAALSTF